MAPNKKRSTKKRGMGRDVCFANVVHALGDHISKLMLLLIPQSSSVVASLLLISSDLLVSR